MTRPDLDEPVRTPVPVHHRVRLASAAIAVVMLGALGVISMREQPARSAAAYCHRIGNAQDLADVLATGDAAQIQAAVARWHSAAQVAPVEIQPQMQQVVAYADHLSRALDNVGDDPGATDAALAIAVREQRDDAPAVETAGASVLAYAKATCQVDLGSAGAPDPAKAG